MSATDYLVENYASHPAFSFPEMPYSVDSSKIASFDTDYKRVANGGQQDDALFKVAKLKLITQAKEIFHEIKVQINDEYESLFLNELESQSLKLLNEELDYYQSVNKSKYLESAQEARAIALKSDRYFFGELSATAVSKIIDIGAAKIEVFRSRAAKGRLTREDLSVNNGLIIARIIRILNNEFRAQGVLDAVSAYMGSNYYVCGLALELSVPQATWWRDTLGLSAPPKTMYAHLDEAISRPKAIVYLSHVNPANGPTSCYPAFHEELHLNALQEIIGRVAGIQNGPVLKDYYGRAYHQLMNSERFRRHFMKLPLELRFNSHMGWDVVPGSETEKKLMSCEQVMTGPPGTFIVFDGARLFHRGGLLESGERIVLQVIFGPVPSFYQRVSSLPRRIVSRIRRLLK